MKPFIIRAHEGDVVASLEETKPSNGSDFSLEEMKEIVGGWIELVYPSRCPDLLMVVNEEGLLKKLPGNMGASALMGQMIAGDVLVCPKEMVK